MEIGAIHRYSRGTYGSPRVHAELQARGVRCAQKRVARIMRSKGIIAKRRRIVVRTTDSSHNYPIAANLLDRRFAPEQVGGMNRAWCGDITYIRTEEGWLYLAVILDLFSRRVVGWSMDVTLHRSLALDALHMALTQRKPAPSLVHHTDRGSQYASSEYREVLKQHGGICSMSRKGECYDNAVAESFFSTLKRELFDERPWSTREAAYRAIAEYIEGWYNPHRRHSSLGNVSPASYELRKVA